MLHNVEVDLAAYALVSNKSGAVACVGCAFLHENGDCLAGLADCMPDGQRNLIFIKKEQNAGDQERTKRWRSRKNKTLEV